LVGESLDVGLKELGVKEQGDSYGRFAEYRDR